MSQRRASANAAQLRYLRKLANTDPARLAEMRRAKKARSKERAKAWRDAYKLSVGCQRVKPDGNVCGYREHPAALDFDHIGPKRKGIAHIDSIPAMLREIESGQCVVTCANCHRVLTYTRLEKKPTPAPKKREYRKAA